MILRLKTQFNKVSIIVIHKSCNIPIVRKRISLNLFPAYKILLKVNKKLQNLFKYNDMGMCRSLEVKPSPALVNT